MEEKRYSLWNSSENRWYGFTSQDGQYQDWKHPVRLTYAQALRELDQFQRTDRCEIREVLTDAEMEDQKRREEHALKWL